VHIHRDKSESMRQIGRKCSHWVIWISLTENVHIDISEPGDKLKVNVHIELSESNWVNVHIELSESNWVNVHIELYEPEDKLKMNVDIELSEYKWRWTFTLNYLNLSTHSTAKAAKWWLR
jgi:hypothetical protein